MTLAPGERLEVFRSRSDNTEVIVCRGWLDTTTCDGLQELIDAAVLDRVGRLRIDLRNLLGVDGAGVRCLLTTAERCKVFGVHVELETNWPVRAALAAHGIGHLAHG